MRARHQIESFDAVIVALYDRAYETQSARVICSPGAAEWKPGASVRLQSDGQSNNLRFMNSSLDGSAPQEFKARRSDGLSPLWVISLFLSLSETVLGIGVLKTEGEIQAALTVFVISFPVLVAVAFFIVLWNRPQVFYRPSDFGNLDPSSFTRGMTPRSDQPEMIEIISRELESKVVSEEVASRALQLGHSADSSALLDELRRAVSDAMKAIKTEAFVRVDAHSVTGQKNAIWEIPYDGHVSVAAFLDDVWFRLREHLPIPPFSYGKDWVLKDSSTENSFERLGVLWARERGLAQDRRLLTEVGIHPGMILEVDLR